MSELYLTNGFSKMCEDMTHHFKLHVESIYSILRISDAALNSCGTKQKLSQIYARITGQQQHFHAIKQKKIESEIFF